MSPAPKRDLPPGMRAQLDASSFQGPATFGMRPLLTEPEQLDEEFQDEPLPMRSECPTCAEPIVLLVQLLHV